MAGTDHTKPVMQGGPAVILVEPQLGENIGMVARAMANFGLSDLRIVNPRDGWPNARAVAASAGAVHVIEGARIFAQLPDALGDLNYCVATTARQRDGFKRVLGPQEAVGNLASFEGRALATGILFGREKSGLSNAEVALADDIVTFPVNPAYASLNIAQAVLLMAYEYVRASADGGEVLPFEGPQFVPAPKTDLYGMFDQLEEALSARNYFRPPARVQVQIEGLRAVLSRPGFSVEEIRLLRGVISSLDRFTRSHPRGAGAPPGEPERDTE